MINPQVKHIFTKLKIEDVCISINDESIGKVPIFDDYKLSFSSFKGKSLKAFELIGNHTVLFFLEDTSRVMDLLKKKPLLLNEASPDWISSLGYKIIILSEIEKFNPPVGYLYNLLKSDRESNYIIYRTFQKPIGITNYDLAKNKINKKMSMFF